jgi:hypothetical protein
MIATVREEDDGWSCDITIHIGVRFTNFTNAVVFAYKQGYKRVVVVFK